MALLERDARKDERAAALLQCFEHIAATCAWFSSTARAHGLVVNDDDEEEQNDGDEAGGVDGDGARYARSEASAACQARRNGRV